MLQLTFKFSLVILSWVAWLRTVSAAGLRHGASREQLMQQEIATEEFFAARIQDQAPNDAVLNPETTSRSDMADKLKNWPVIDSSKPKSTNNNYRKPQWESAVDKKSGRTFYFDRATNRSQWEVPEGETEHLPNVLPMNPNKFEDGRRHTNFKMYKGEDVDLTCLRHTGNRCELVQFGTDLLHSCPQITGGPSTCAGGVGGGECRCDEGYCSTSKGHCHADRSTYVQGTFAISTKGTPNEYLCVSVSQDGTGTGYVTLSSNPNDSACRWRIVTRPDASHIFTTVKYPFAAVDFFNVCIGDACSTHVGLTVNPEGNEIGSQLKFAQRHLVIADTHSDNILYFPHLRDQTAAKVAEGCLPNGYECPSETGYLVFTPELPADFLENLEDVDYEYWKNWGLYILAGISFSVLILTCWYQLFTEVKGSRFH